MTRGQSRALEQHWKDYGIDFSRERLDLTQCFGRRAPKILDIGAGMGDAVIQLATRHPENDYLAVEVHRPGVGALIRQAVDKDVQNIRIIKHDVMEVVEYQIAPASLDEVYVFFPDPWYKRRHHKRRLINPPFLQLLLPTLKSHARLYIATDWADMAAHIQGLCDKTPGIANLAGAGKSAPRPGWRPLTRFEARAHRLGHKTWDFIYARTS